MRKMSQEDKILEYLKQGKRITPLQALDKFGTFRLSGRIYNLRAQGYNICSDNVKRNEKYFAQYWLD